MIRDEHDRFEKLKKKLRQEERIDFLIDSIALAEKLNFTIMSCESAFQAKAALEVLEQGVADVRGEPVRFVRFAFTGKDKEPATFKMLVAQILEPLYYWEDKDDENKVLVIDASNAGEEDREGWIILFQRMNEVRNTLMEGTPGPLLLVLPYSLEVEFAHRAPDFWSVRSAFVRAEASIIEKSSLQKYLDRMKALYGTMQIWRMATPVTLEDIFTHVNVLSTPSAFRRGPWELLEEIYRRKTSFGKAIEKGKDGLKAVQEAQKLFILGKPGSGKTTFLKHVTLKATEDKLDYVPIFVSLRSFSESGLSLFDFITRQFEICDFPDAQPFITDILKQGRAIILCDALDEVNKEKGLRNQVIQELIAFSKTHDKSKFVVTCRVAASEYRFEDFTYVEMADFDEAQIKMFVYKWFTRDDQIADNFLKEFDDIRNDRLRDLGKSPLLLTLLCIGFEETLSFPSRRSEIYEEAIDTLLRKWDVSRKIKRDEIYQKLSLGRKRQMFTRIAYETFEDGEYLIKLDRLGEKVAAYLKNLPPSDAQEDIDGATVIKAIEAQHGIFVERAQGIYSFSHLTFQEYYTAKYIVAHHKDTLKHLIQEHLTDETWREIFVLTAEMLDDADEFFEIFMKRLDDFVVSDDRLRRLLTKAEEEAYKIDIEARPFQTRSAIVSLILIPSEEASREEWKKFADALSDIMRTHFTIEDYEFTEKEAEHVEQYLYATKLLIDCLEVAYVSDRNAIEERLLVPPPD